MPVDLRCKHDREVRARASDLFAVATVRPHMDAPPCAQRRQAGMLSIKPRANIPVRASHAIGHAVAPQAHRAP